MKAAQEIRGLSRREFVALASASVVAAAAGCRSEKSMAERKEPSTNELVELSAADVVAKLRNGEVTAERYATALLERCQQGKALNAFITLPQQRVLEAARVADRLRSSGAKLGALHGLPIPVKDSVNTKDMPQPTILASGHSVPTCGASSFPLPHLEQDRGRWNGCCL